MKLVIKELIVYQEAKALGFVIEDDSLESRIESLKSEMPDLYLLCMEQYGSETEYKKTLSYTMLYDMVYDYFSVQFMNSLDYNIGEIKEEAIEYKYVSEAEMEADEERIVISYLCEKYRDEIRNYFEEWNNKEFEKANIVYKK